MNYKSELVAKDIDPAVDQEPYNYEYSRIGEWYLIPETERTPYEYGKMIYTK